MTTIRHLTPADVAAFKTLRIVGINATPANFWPSAQEELASCAADVAARIERTDLQVTFGTFLGDSLVAIAGLRRLPFTKLNHKAMIWGVLVDPDHRGKGLARELLNALTAYAVQTWSSAQIHLGVNAENPAALKLYESLGFVQYGLEPRALQLDDRFYDEIYMVKTLR